MSFTDFLEKKLLDHVWGGGDYVRAGTVYVGLSTTTVNDDGTGITEPSGGAYARVAVTNNVTNFPASSGSPSTKSNGTAITFPQASASWGTITHFFISDASSGGNILASGALTASKTVGANDTASFAVGDLAITLD
jgi:hypothetical protein